MRHRQKKLIYVTTLFFIFLGYLSTLSPCCAVAATTGNEQQRLYILLHPTLPGVNFIKMLQFTWATCIICSKIIQHQSSCWKTLYFVVSQISAVKRIHETGPPECTFVASPPPPLLPFFESLAAPEHNTKTAIGDGEECLRGTARTSISSAAAEFNALSARDRKSRRQSVQFPPAEANVEIVTPSWLSHLRLEYILTFLLLFKLEYWESQRLQQKLLGNGLIKTLASSVPSSVASFGRNCLLFGCGADFNIYSLPFLPSSFSITS